MNRFVLKNTFIKVYIYYFSINIFIETRSQNCVFGDRVAVQNDFLYEYGGIKKQNACHNIPAKFLCKNALFQRPPN